MKLRDKVIKKEVFDNRNGWGMGKFGTVTTYASGFEEVIEKTQHRHTGISTDCKFRFKDYSFIHVKGGNPNCDKISILENSLGHRGFAFGDVKEVLTKELPKRERYDAFALTYDEYVESVQKHCLFKQVELLK